MLHCLLDSDRKVLVWIWILKRLNLILKTGNFLHFVTVCLFKAFTVPSGLSWMLLIFCTCLFYSYRSNIIPVAKHATFTDVSFQRATFHPLPSHLPICQKQLDSSLSLCGCSAAGWGSNPFFNCGERTPRDSQKQQSSSEYWHFVQGE